MSIILSIMTTIVSINTGLFLFFSNQAFILTKQIPVIVGPTISRIFVRRDDIIFSKMTEFGSHFVNESVEDIITEMNNYFNGYLSGQRGGATNIAASPSTTLSGENDNFDESIDAINAFDDAMASNEAASFDEQFDAINSHTGSITMTDTEVLDKFIDKQQTGGKDATEILKNMTGGAKKKSSSKTATIERQTIFNNPHTGRLFNTDIIDNGEPREFDMNNLRGGFTGEFDLPDGDNHEQEEFAETDDNEENTHVGDVEVIQKDNSVSDEPDEGSEESDASDEEASSDDLDDYGAAPTDEVDRILTQLRNRAGRTLTGGSLNVKKRAVLTDMYPYIIRS